MNKNQHISVHFSFIILTINGTFHQYIFITFFRGNVVVRIHSQGTFKTTKNCYYIFHSHLILAVLRGTAVVYTYFSSHIIHKKIFYFVVNHLKVKNVLNYALKHDSHL